MGFSFSRLRLWWSRTVPPRRHGPNGRYFADQHLSDLAHDCGLSIQQLQRFVRLGPAAAGELYRTMAALGIDVQAVRTSYRGTLRDMQIICVECRVKEICRQNLKACSTPRRVYDYCENAWTFRLLPKAPAPGGTAGT